MKNIGEAFTFPFKDPNWLSKFLLGGIFVLLSCLLIGIPVLFGYYIELIQRMRRNEPQPLPEWSEPGVKFITGFKFLVTLFVYYIPLVVLAVPLFIILIISAVQQSTFAGLFGGATALTVVFLVIIPYSLFITILTPVIAIRFAERESISDGLQIGTILTLFKKHWQDAVIATLITIGVGTLASLGLIFFIVGIFVTSFYASLIRFHMYGQIAQAIDQATTYQAMTAV